MSEKRRVPQSGKSPPTIRDVARRAGVSPGTVSNVLIGVRGVRPESRTSVMNAAEALGYKSNHMASSLRRGHTRTIGIVVPDLANEFFSGLVTQWEAQAANAGYEILVASSGEDFSGEEMIGDREDLRGVAELILAKQRNGPTGDVTLAYRKEYMRFENYAGGGGF